LRCGELEANISSLFDKSFRIFVADFEYNYTRDGTRYGWGKARYTTPELMYGDVFALPDCTPEESLACMVQHLEEQFPGVGERTWRELLG
jgi:hypothetical protein